MQIFTSYTGNAMLNNALMTVEALSNLSSVSEVTPELLQQLYSKYKLSELNKRLKSYTMLFTKNGPLHNDAKNGVKVYNSIMSKLLLSVETEGNKVCELSGLRFNITFEELFKSALKEIGFSDKEIKGKDTSLNRTWFPLIGGLGSDAQALPQAKFTIQIHPVCIAIMQFLPLSSLLYKGGILLIDSSNFEFARTFVAQNTKLLQQRIETSPLTSSVENVRDFSKGNYLLKALEILGEKEFDDEYSDLNLWSFSNSGTGASCEIERIPNELISKLRHLYENSLIGNELKGILTNAFSASSFIKALEYNEDWFLLYPQDFGSGKKKIEHEGYSIEFLEAFYKEIKSEKLVEYAKYLSCLIYKYRSDSFKKILVKKDAYNEKEYRVELYKVLVSATQQGEWDLFHHIDILDEKDYLPVKNTFYAIHKLTHFYYQRELKNAVLPEIKTKSSAVLRTCEWLIAHIQNDIRREKTIKELRSSQNYSSVGYNDIFLRYAQLHSLPIPSLLYAFYNDKFIFVKSGLNELLRIFFNQVQQPEYETGDLIIPKDWLVDGATLNWINDIQSFCRDYQKYYYNKYENKLKGVLPYAKFLNQILSIPDDLRSFLKWLDESTMNTNNFLKENKISESDKWSSGLLYTPAGEYASTFSRFTLKVMLLEQYQVSMDVASVSTELLNQTI